MGVKKSAGIKRRAGRRKSAGRRKMVAAAIGVVVLAYLAVQYVLCGAAVADGHERLKAFDAKTIELGSGTMAYIDEGEGDAILSIHGICGGYDAGYWPVAGMASDYRVIAPSRFGYPGSDAPENPAPEAQAEAFAELLEGLGVDRVFLLATSAGGTVALRFALDYPERVRGLILYSSAAPQAEKPDKYPGYAGPPKFLCSNFGIWLFSPLFKPVMGMAPETIHTMMPFDERRDGTIIDAEITNPDMAKNYDDYKIESLRVPVLIFQAKDDKMADYGQMVGAVHRFPDCEFVVFEDGGHLMSGHGEEIDSALRAFVLRYE